MKKTSKVPDATIERLARYSRPLEILLKSDTRLISSEKLAKSCGVNPAQVRKDLAYFGEFGVRGVGYDVSVLLAEIKKILATDREWRLCIVGVGNLGSALVANENFGKRGYNVVAAFDSDPKKIGAILPCGLKIEPSKKIITAVTSLEIEIGVITTPPQTAQSVADLLMEAGIKAILNFAPIQVKAPECCTVENVDFTIKLEKLAYHLAKVPLEPKP
ncbi:MAG: redox-sensing transcriptional repressor Rex [Desulfatiglans sp.]|jgi:redox-sensing transcriptional repressor|nr:redox-sensing transcriptional repressor Rex [Thermodesulfobacteriota bacterium]MEE4351864.1 redox-sensing transcriptional repressor Rex [Desulfatiglans sp.]